MHELHPIYSIRCTVRIWFEGRIIVLIWLCLHSSTSLVSSCLSMRSPKMEVTTCPPRSPPASQTKDARKPFTAASWLLFWRYSPSLVSGPSRLVFYFFILDLREWRRFVSTKILAGLDTDTVTARACWRCNTILWRSLPSIACSPMLLWCWCLFFSGATQQSSIGEFRWKSVSFPRGTGYSLIHTPSC